MTKIMARVILVMLSLGLVVGVSAQERYPSGERYPEAPSGASLGGTATGDIDLGAYQLAFDHVILDGSLNDQLQVLNESGNDGYVVVHASGFLAEDTKTTPDYVREIIGLK